MKRDLLILIVCLLVIVVTISINLSINGWWLASSRRRDPNSGDADSSRRPVDAAIATPRGSNELSRVAATTSSSRPAMPRVTLSESEQRFAEIYRTLQYWKTDGSRVDRLQAKVDTKTRYFVFQTWQGILWMKAACIVRFLFCFVFCCPGLTLRSNGRVGGFNNERMSLEIACVAALLTHRTLVMPPAYPLYLLDSSALEGSVRGCLCCCVNHHRFAQITSRCQTSRSSFR